LSINCPTVSFTTQVSNVSCCDVNDGSITLSSTGSNTPYFFDWEDDQYDGNSVLAGLSPGNYAVTIYDAFECSVDTSFLISAPRFFD